MATSIDGFITKGENVSDWVSKSDWEQFNSYIKSSDAVIMGRKTMDQFGEDFPINGLVNIVLSNNKTLHKQDDNMIVMSGTPTDVIEVAKHKNLERLLLIGGAKTNEQFLRANLIDEIVLSVHPLVIGNGLKLFGDSAFDIKLDLLGSKEINSELVQIRYKTKK